MKYIVRSYIVVEQEIQADTVQAADIQAGCALQDLLVQADCELLDFLQDSEIFDGHGNELDLEVAE